MFFRYLSLDVAILNRSLFEDIEIQYGQASAPPAAEWWQILTKSTLTYRSPSQPVRGIDASEETTDRQAASGGCLVDKTLPFK